MSLLNRIAPKLAEDNEIKKAIQKWSKPKTYRIGNMTSDPDYAAIHPLAWGKEIEKPKEYHDLTHKVIWSKPGISNSASSSYVSPEKSSAQMSKIHPGSMSNSNVSDQTPETEIAKRLNRARNQLKTLNKSGLTHSLDRQ